MGNRYIRHPGSRTSRGLAISPASYAPAALNEHRHSLSNITDNLRGTMAATRAVWDRSAYDASSIAGSLSIVNPRLAGAHVGLSTRVALRQRRSNDEAARDPEATGTMDNSA